MDNGSISRILIRVEGNDLVGHGHFMRCLTIARYLQQDFECIFAMSTTSDWVMTQLNEYNLTVIDLPHREQFHPDDPRSNEPWACDVQDILRPADILILDGYRFDSTFHEVAQRIGAKTIRIIDDLEGPAHCDAIITQLPIEHSEVQAKLGIDTAWTGLDGFLVRPEFYAAQKMEIPIRYDFFIYVTNPVSFKFYSTFPTLYNHDVFAIAPTPFTEQCKDFGWRVGHQLSAEDIAQKMKESREAILPASSIAIEFSVATGKRPWVSPLACNQKYAFEINTTLGYWTPVTSHDHNNDAEKGAFLFLSREKFTFWINSVNICI